MQEIRDASPGLVLPIIVFILIRASYSDILLLKNLSDIPESNRVHQKSNQAFKFQVSSLLSKALVYIYINNKRIFKYKNNGVVMVVTKVKIM